MGIDGEYEAITPGRMVIDGGLLQSFVDPQTGRQCFVDPATGQSHWIDDSHGQHIPSLASAAPARVAVNPAQSRLFAFDGGAGSYLGVVLVSVLVTIISLGFLFLGRWSCSTAGEPSTPC